jgi:cytochrome c peroxidase
MQRRKRIQLKLSKTQGIVALGLIVFFGCEKETTPTLRRSPVLPEIPYHYSILPATVPADFEPFGSGFSVDDHKATLGRVLFYDTQLSLNNRISCGSCHIQEKAFADIGRFSSGLENGLTPRNTPAIINAGSQSHYFWDQREDSLRSMVLRPIANHVEMGLDRHDYMVAKVRSLPYYSNLFQNAFGDTAVSPQRIAEGLENFVRSIVTVRSKFDQANGSFSNFTEQELRGLNKFRMVFPCSQCHGGPNFGGTPSIDFNIGLDEEYKDVGVAGFGEDGQPKNGWFKTPSLRNIELTAPYMHDGRFATLEEVLEFYNSGIHPHPQLATQLRMREDGGFSFLGPPIDVNQLYPGWTRLPARMFMTPDDKADLIAFMKTLTDYELLRDPKFSDPFVVK